MRTVESSLRWKFLVATFVAIGLLFLVTGLVIEDRTASTATRSLEAEAQASLHAYESLWRARVDVLASVSLTLSGMSDVRAAFGTRDVATIRDTARERWVTLARENAIFLVTDPRGRVIASLGERPPAAVAEDVAVVRESARRFPNQATGFLYRGGGLYQVVITPVYVDSSGGAALLNVLLAGYRVDAQLARRLRETTGGSEFVFAVNRQVVASTLSPEAAASAAAVLFRGAAERGIERVNAGGIDYLALHRPLLDLEGRPLGEVCILRSFETAQQAVSVLRRDLAFVWVGALVAALALTWLLAQHLLKPIALLDRAAAEVARQNYAHRVPVVSGDELGRLAVAFNRMCESLQKAKEDLIRQERLATISRLSSSLVHDLRNPLAAVYAGTEVLVDPDLPLPQTRRLAKNIHRAAVQIHDMLQELINVSRGRPARPEECPLQSIVETAWEFVAARADAAGVTLRQQITGDVPVSVERTSMVRVFMNLFSNAIEAMPNGGVVTVRVRAGVADVLVEVEDSGCGIEAGLRDGLFEPFAAGAKKNGMGLGLALSRQTVRDHGGDLWADEAVEKGARFCLRLPSAPVRSTVT